MCIDVRTICIRSMARSFVKLCVNLQALSHFIKLLIANKIFDGILSDVMLTKIYFIENHSGDFESQVCSFNYCRCIKVKLHLL